MPHGKHGRVLTHTPMISCFIISDGIPALVKLLKSDRSDIQSVAASVLCNISEEGVAMLLRCWRLCFM